MIHFVHHKDTGYRVWDIAIKRGVLLYPKSSVLNPNFAEGEIL